MPAFRKIRGLLLSLLLAVPAMALESGGMLRVGGDSFGPLAAPDSYRSFPVGCANIYGGKRDDLFLSAPVGRETGVWLYRYLDTGDDGVLKFDSPRKLSIPWLSKPPFSGWVREWDGKLFLGWYSPAEKVKKFGFNVGIPRKLLIGEFNRETLTVEPPRSFPLPAAFPARITAISPGAWKEGDEWEFFLLGSDFGLPPSVRSRDPQAPLYDGAGIFRDGLARDGVYRFTLNFATGKFSPAELRSATDRDILGGYGLALYRDTLVIANRFGVFFALKASDRGKAPRELFAGGKVIFHPTYGPMPVFYPATTEYPAALLAGGEGALYSYAEKATEPGTPLNFELPAPVLEKNAFLYGGALTVPNLVDWDGDGVLDIVSGNSEGRVLFFRNEGSNETPAFRPGTELLAAGVPIHIQPGYYGIQGPGEARWGYSCPAVADWNGDGLPDLLLSDATGRHRVFLNVGSRAEPALAAERILKEQGLELRGSWRVKPGVAELAGRMAYVIYDGENYLRLYWRIDDEFLQDGGRLRWRDGREIKVYYSGLVAPGQSGRGKITLTDWDGDGRTDILLGTTRRNCLPGPKRGLPWSRFSDDKVLAMSILFLRNIGSDAEPVFDFPKQFQWKGRDFYFGNHTSGAAVGNLGGDENNLLVGNESGRFFFFRHSDLTFTPFEF